MKRVKSILTALALAAALLMTSGCGVRKIKDIKFTSFDISSAHVTSSRSADAVLSIGIDNPARAFTVSGISATVHLDGRPLASASADTLFVPGKTAGTYQLPCSAALVPGVSLFEVLPLLSEDSLPKLKADISLRFKMKGLPARNLEYKDLTLADFER